jgi:hypothetical protein
MEFPVDSPPGEENGVGSTPEFGPCLPAGDLHERIIWKARKFRAGRNITQCSLHAPQALKKARIAYTHLEMPTQIKNSRSTG